MRRAVRVLMLTAAMVLALAPAAMAIQPTGVGNADGRNGGVTTPGPHCHENLRSSVNGSEHGTIVTGAIHEAHLITNGAAGGVFNAVGCP